MTDDPAAMSGGDGAEPADAFPVPDDPAGDAPASIDGGGDERMGGPALDAGDASLLALVDRLGTLLDRSDLSELAVESGGTRLVLRKAAAIAPVAVAAAPAAAGDGRATAGASGASDAAGASAATAAQSRPSVNAPLTGVWYGSPAPGSAPFVAAGREVAVGQVIGLIEAMKLFNEIKSDLAGRVVRVVPENGALVKAKQPLIEVEPL
ncbi:MAG TPA: biotin/lipoyl-containing protein [Candidatus Limnocylindrales bacterium]|jgi:acetyl-CoA carboxylase biotin carboxyl carrier protein